ncbi:MAG: TonB-dependent hemoglobin/transferrin/lactoferrin family receptor [Candidatus Omnitrophica bacterium]|nr:TonB-dependent hemoglobin/transferrin/lactoferrin family receptor [Candidatus Omnitrophota bacterium]
MSKQIMIVFGGIMMLSTIMKAEVSWAVSMSERADRMKDRVVIIGTKTETTLFDSPQSVGLLTAEDLEKSLAQDLGEALQEIPGVNIDGGPRAIGKTPNIRGLSDSRVQLRLDGARMNFLTGHKGQLFVDVDNIQKIEVLKGGASALYGSDAMGGVINITTKDPGDLLKEGKTLGMKLGVDYNSVNVEHQESLSFFTKPTEKFEFITNYNRWDSAPKIRLGDGTHLNNAEQKGFDSLNKMILHPTESSDVTFTYNKYDENAKVPSNPASTVSNENPLQKRETERQLVKIGIANKAAGEFFEDFGADIYYQTTEITEDRQNAALREDTLGIGTFGFEVKNSNILDVAGLPNILTYGIEYYKDIAEGERNTGTGGADLGSFPNGNFQGGAVFLQDEISFFDDKLTVIPGVRWDYFKSESSLNSKNTDNRVSPKIALVYRIVEELNFFTSYGLGFRAPRLLELYPSGQHFPGNNFQSNSNLKPEKSQNFEAGFRGDWGRFSFETAYFLIKADDFIETIVAFDTFPGTTTSRNVSEVEIWGVENSVDFYIGSGLSTFAGFDIIRGKDITDETPLTSIMPDQLRWGLKYQNEEDTLHASLTGRFVDKQYRTPDSSTHTSGYAVWDIKTQIAIPGLEDAKLSLGIENVFDRAYREHLSSIPAAGRNFVVGLSKSVQW